MTVSSSSGTTWRVSPNSSPYANTSNDTISIDLSRWRSSRSRGSRSGSAGCNESSKYDNDEKALFHGLKSAFRMSREYDGREYGTADPPYTAAARIAANVAVAYLAATDQPYTREASHQYVDEEFARTPGFAERFFGGEKPLAARVGAAEFEAAMGHAWTQVDSKANHYDAARTALAAAEAFLDADLAAEAPDG